MASKARRSTRPVDDWSDDYVAEHGYLVGRGVRPMAIVGNIQVDQQGMLEAASRLETIGAQTGALPFVIPRADGFADCGYAASRWVVDLYEWLVASDAVPTEHWHRIRGLLLGYGSDAIRAHEELGCGRRFTSSPVRVSTSQPSRRRGKAGTRAPSA